MQSMRQLFGKIIPTNWWDMQALIQPQSSVAKKLAAKQAEAQAQEETRAKKYSGESGVVQTGNRRDQNPAA